MTFQGGFVGTTCTVEVPAQSVEEEKTQWRTWTQIFPEDVNRAQSFDFPAEGVETGVESLRLVFEKSSWEPSSLAFPSSRRCTFALGPG